jgi:1-acyl-sn-glycerol-3-phosphate acyltransferase
MGKKRLTIAEKLSRRHFRRPSHFIYGLYHFLSWHLILKKYHPSITIKDDVNSCEGPCFLIWNHLSRIDHAYLVEATYPKRFNILAGYNEFFRSHLAFPFRLMNILPKKNYTIDPLGVKAILSILHQGGSVAFSPEGMSSIYGTNQPVVAGTGHLLKHCDVPVYFMRLRGAYLANTKVCLDERLGKCEAEVSLLFSKEELQTLSNEEIEDRINLAFRNDDYAYAKEQHVAWKSGGRICEHLHDLCYACPKCGKDLSMTSSGDHIECVACGNGAKMNDYYEFEPYQGAVIPSSPSEWVLWERKKIMKEIRADPAYSFSVKTTIGFLPKYHYIKHKKTANVEGEGTFYVDHQGVHFKGKRKGQDYSFDQDWAEVFSLVIVTDMQQFSLYVHGEYVEFVPLLPAVGKLLLLCEEMHRLHDPSWKRFPWEEEALKSIAY